MLRIVGSCRSGKTSAVLGLAKVFDAIILFRTNIEAKQAYMIGTLHNLSISVCDISHFWEYISKGTYPCTNTGDINIILDDVSLEEYEFLKNKGPLNIKLNLIGYTQNVSKKESEEK